MKRMKKSAVACLMVASTMALNIPNVRLNAKGISHIPLHDRDINFKERSLFIPKMTIHQQNTILYNSLPLLFLNTDNNCFPFYNASNFWKNPYCSTGYTNTLSILTTDKDNALTANGFVANCSSVAGVTTYNPYVATDADFTSFVQRNVNNKIGNMTNNNVLRHNYNNSIYNRVRSKNYNGISSNSGSTSIPTTTGEFPNKCIAIGGGSDDVGSSIIQTTDGGYAIAGYTKSFGAGEEDVYVVKLDGSWNIQWTRTIGGKEEDEGFSIIQTTDGGYAVVGRKIRTTLFSNIYFDVYVVKLDSKGNLQWTRTIGGGDDDMGESIIQTSDGGYAIAGRTRSYSEGWMDVYIVKLDASGNLQWTRTIGGIESDNAFSIIQTRDGGYAVAGDTRSFGAGGADVYVVKLDGSGNIQWKRTIGGEDYDYGYSIIQTTDGGYAIAGYTWSFGAGAGDVYVVKLDVNGNLQWTRTIGGGNTGGTVSVSGRIVRTGDAGRSIIQTLDGGFVIAGSTDAIGSGGYDIYVVKLDANGNLQWTRTIGGRENDGANSIIQTTDGGYVIAGYTESFGAGLSDIYLVKLDGNGNLGSCPGGCQVGSGGSVSSGGKTSSGGWTGKGGKVSSGGNIGSGGGTLTKICP
jgi:hypothetical protein